MKFPNTLFAAVMASLAIANADLVISEIDLTNNKVEILNTGPGTENLTGYFLCNRLNGSPFYPAITTSLIDLPNSSSSTLTLTAGQWITLQMTAGFIPDASGEVGLYISSSNFGLAANMRDYVGWGADGVRDSVAAAKGIWGSGTFVSVTGITAGQTIQLGAGLSGNQQSHYSLAASTIGVNQVTPPPVATTGSASSITVTAADLSGTVNAKGASTTVTFQYGETLAYGNTVAATPSPVTGTTNTAVSAALTGLVAGTTYNFRVVAVSANGTTQGANQTFTTAAPPVATTGTASDITTNAATLSGTVNAKSASTTVTFEYGETLAYGTTVTATPSPVTGTSTTAVSAALTGLAADTTYHYRVVAVSANGNTPGADQTFTTAAPPVATTGTASGITTNAATVSGTVNAKGASTTVTFEYGETPAYGTTVTATPSPVTGTSDTAVSAALAGLVAGTTYHYRVVAVSANGNTPGSDQTFTTAANPPPVATTGTSSGISTTAATLSGTVNANGSSTTVTFEYGETLAYGTTVTATPSPVTGTSDTAVTAALTGLTADTTYHFRVVADSANGNTPGADQTFTTAAPPMVVLSIGAVNRSGNTLTVDFTGPPNTPPSAWEVAGSATLASFPDNKTADTTFSETPAGSGIYRALIDISGEPQKYFVRIALPSP
jgi:phosphodiesterase/alkaline phosphatase D-like protein